MKHYVVLTIGPVQSYISQARRTQDLWQGSRILSYLSGIGIKKVIASSKENSGIDLIYPPPMMGGSDNIPNRMVIEVAGEREEAAELARQVKSAIENAWLNVAANTLELIADQMGGVSSVFTDIWQRQVSNWLEVYWVVTEEQASYPESIRYADQMMGARKMVRNFPPFAEPGRKCSVTGEYEALRDEDSGGYRAYDKFWRSLRIQQRNLSLLSQHERLSAIATIKRFAHERAAAISDLQLNERFPSTSSIAAASFRFDVLMNWSALEAPVRAYLDALEVLFDDITKLYFSDVERFPYFKGRIAAETLDNDTAKRFCKIDGDYLYEDTLITITIAEYAGLVRNGKPDREQVNKRDLENTRKRLNELYSAASKLGIPLPYPYFVILSMDGDNMGKTLGVIPNKKAHKLFSETIARFAGQDVPRIVQEEHLGRVVYAGGDDVLALLPVRDALEVAEKLRTSFRETVRHARIPGVDPAQYTFETEDGIFINAHASAGLAYVHHTHNLQNAVNAANSAQKELAKKLMGRDAIAVKLLRRSGEPREMAHKWITQSGMLVVDRVMKLIHFFADGRLSRNLAQDIHAIIYSMTDAKDGADVLIDARQAELNRVVRRRLDIKKHQAERKVLKELAEELTNDIEVLAQNPHDNTRERWQNALHWIELARFIAQSGLSGQPAQNKETDLT